MKALIEAHNAIFAPVDDRAALIIPTLARLVFFAVLFFYFWNSAMTKIDGSIFSPSSGAFAQIFPKAAEAATYDVSKLNIFQRIIIFFGTIAEFVLPILLLVGFLTRFAAIGMIGFICVMTLVDVTGHGVALGSLFDSAQQLIDQRVMWTFLFLVLIVKGAGPLSLDRLIGLK